MRYADSRCEYREVYEPQHAYIFTGPCIITKKQISVTIPAKELNAYRRGALIQEAMPSLTASEREFLMSGMSDEAWNQTMKDED
jgi:hypothetical protein